MKFKMSTKAVWCTVSLLAFLFVSEGANAYRFDFITVSDVVSEVKKKFGSLDSYQASFTIVSDKLGKRKRQTGTVKYKANNKLLIEFRRPYGQKIISNGSTMWIYIPSMNVVAEQDLKEEPGLFATTSKSGLRTLFAKYHYRFASKEQPEKQRDGSKMYTLLLKQKESRAGYRDIKLWISEDYFIRKASGKTSTGKEIDIVLSDIKTNIKLPNALFKFDIPARARVIKNPMISEE